MLICESKEHKTRIISVKFDQFKSFSHYSISLDRVNILAGPNNSGKSTIIGALRMLACGLKFARTKTPERIELESGVFPGYRIPEASFPVSLENVHTDYAETESKITFSLSNHNKIHLIFPQDGGCILIPESKCSFITSSSSFKKSFPINLTVIPVLGPIEHKERLREKETVVSGLTTHRASRHFRNYWYYFNDGFQDFAEMVRSTWPGMEINPPEISDIISGELSMFCLEDRMTRELYWVGFGFQIWCQLLTHLSRAVDSSMIVIDEPEIYLHPDVQRQLLSILRDIGPDVVLATHSTEIMSEADPSEIILVDKKKIVGERLRDISGVQRALDSVGSIQNITLTSLSRNKRILFVEGDYDFRLLRRFARKIGLLELSAGMGITPLVSGGFGSWKRITILASGIAEAIGSILTIAAIYDRDYFCQEEIDSVRSELEKNLKLAHVHDRKEIENYLLVPAALDRAIARARNERSLRTGASLPEPPKAIDLLYEISNPLKDEVQSQFIARRTNFLRSSGKDLADITRETLAWFSTRWDDLNERIILLPGKDVLQMIRERIQFMLGISLTDARIIESMHKEEIPTEIKSLLYKLDLLRKSS